MIQFGTPRSPFDYHLIEVPPTRPKTSRWTPLQEEQYRWRTPSPRRIRHRGGTSSVDRTPNRPFVSPLHLYGTDIFVQPGRRSLSDPMARPGEAGQEVCSSSVDFQFPPPGRRGALDRYNTVSRLLGMLRHVKYLYRNSMMTRTNVYKRSR